MGLTYLFDSLVWIGSPTKDPDSPPVGTSGCRVGRVKGINDESEEIVDVKISRFEAEILMRHWFKTYWDNAYHCRVHPQHGAREWRVSVYAGYRMNTFKNVISQEYIGFLEAEGTCREAEIDAARAEFEAKAASWKRDSA